MYPPIKVGHLFMGKASSFEKGKGFFSSISIPRIQRSLPKKTPIDGVSNVLVVASGKGGVGKSTVAVNLAVSLASLSNHPRIGLLDADLFGPSIPRMMNLPSDVPLRISPSQQLEPRSNYGVKCMSMGFLLPSGQAGDAVVWRGLMVMRAVEQLLWQVSWAPLDILVIDMPPGTGDTQLTVSQSIPIAGALLVATPQNVAIDDCRRAASMFRKVNVNILGLVNNMDGLVCECGKRHDVFRGVPGALEALVAEEKIEMLARIPIDTATCISGDRGRPIVIEQPHSIASLAYKSLAESIWQKIYKQA